MKVIANIVRIVRMLCSTSWRRGCDQSSGVRAARAGLSGVLGCWKISMMKQAWEREEASFMAVLATWGQGDG